MAIWEQCYRSSAQMPTATTLSNHNNYVQLQFSLSSATYSVLKESNSVQFIRINNVCWTQETEFRTYAKLVVFKATIGTERGLFILVVLWG